MVREKMTSYPVPMHDSGLSWAFPTGMYYMHRNCPPNSKLHKKEPL